MERSIVHMDLDTFFVSCERLLNSKLNGIPLIIGGGTDRGVVASSSYEARKFGVRSAMPMRMALQLCPQATVVKGDMDLYIRQSNLVTQIISEEAPVMEKASVDEFYLDVSGMDKFFGCYKWTSELIQRIKTETGLPMSFGLSINKTVSKIATGEGKPTGKLQIPSSQVNSFLNPLPIKKIPMIGDATEQLLSRSGFRIIKQLASTDVELLDALLGKNGVVIWKKANGIDTTPVEPYTEKKSVSTERTFDKDTIDIPMIRNLLIAMIEKLAHELREDNWVTSCITIKIRYTNFDTHTKQCKIKHTSCDHIIRRYVDGLFDKLYDRRMRIRLLGLKFTDLQRGGHQIDLFDDTVEDMSLYNALDYIKKRYGVSAVMRAAGLDSKVKSKK